MDACTHWRHCVIRLGPTPRPQDRVNLDQFFLLAHQASTNSAIYNDDHLLPSPPDVDVKTTTVCCCDASSARDTG